MATLEELQKQIAELQESVAAITAPPTDYYTHRWSGEEIDRGVASGLTMGGAETSQAALAALGAGVRPNELDNPYFFGGGTGSGVFPVNQRGQVLYEKGAAFDRWACDGQTTLNQEGAFFSATFYQGATWEKMRRFLGKKVTLSAFFGPKRAISGTVTLSESYASNQMIETTNDALRIFIAPNTNSSQIFRLTGGGSETFAAVKFEEGPNQTLFYQKPDGDYALLPQPDCDYAMQLLKCRWYGESLAGGRASGVATSGNFLAITYPFFVEKRMIPVLNTDQVSLTNLLFDNTAGTLNTPIAISVRGLRRGGAVLGFTGTFTNGHEYSIVSDTSGGFFDANL
ncbi:MAG: hypothetical protein ACOX7N_08200 [Lawsonibacter sp.]|jgi:hypothetical protein